ncbi:MAG: hypothetical protein KGL39_32665 [Patescibacteria group bacterium]|nr:hypothetical protein [Patescibacteria group bacterium]
MLKVGSTLVNPDTVTHVEEKRDGLLVHFVGGSNKLFTGDDAEEVKNSLTPKDTPPKQVMK